MHINSPGQLHPSAILCADTYDAGILRGRLYDPHSSRTYHFSGLSHFLIAMEHILDGAAAPQSFNQVRTFPGTRPGGLPDSSGGHITEGALATFPIQVMFRQNASWQGSVGWLEENINQPFRSVLELICLIDSVLTQSARIHAG